MSRGLVCCFLLGLIACGQAYVPNNEPVVIDPDASPGTEMDMGAGTTKPDMPSVQDMMRDPKGPEIRELSVKPESLTPRDDVKVIATVTDPDGFADIGGGRILTRQGGLVKTFEGSGGSFEATFSWDEVAEELEPDFELVGQVIFVAEFFDGMNHRTTQEFTLSLSCGEPVPACGGVCGTFRCGEECKSFSRDTSSRECGGMCVDVHNDDANCGMCGNACPEGQKCTHGVCEEGGDVGLLGMCAEDQECAMGECSSVAAGQDMCVLRCDSSNSCPSDLACLTTFGFCLQSCQEPSDCPSGTQCVNQEALMRFTSEPLDGDYCAPLFSM